MYQYFRALLPIIGHVIAVSCSNPGSAGLLLVALCVFEAGLGVALVFASLSQVIVRDAVGLLELKISMQRGGTSSP